jgi:hypothetical protein
MNAVDRDDRGFFEVIFRNGRSLLVLLALGLLLSGLFALFLGVTGQFLPHDVRFLRMTAERLCSLHGCRIVHFMIHDRIAFGGALVAIGLLYLWLIEFPLRQGMAWAWWLLLVSGTVGFASFLAYLNYGYLDTWHGVATLVLLPCFVLGLVCSCNTLTGSRSVRSLLATGVRLPWRSAEGMGRACFLATAVGMTFAGLTILTVGTTCVFVPQDLSFLRLSVEEMDVLNPRLVPLIAHDRAGFGGAVCCSGIILFFSVWCGTPSRSLWQVLCLAGLAGFGSAIGVHFAIGYLDPIHLAPAVLGALLYSAGLVLAYQSMIRGKTPSSSIA